MRVLVCGGRDYDDRATMQRELIGLPLDSVIVHGDAHGADRLAADIAPELSHGYITEAHPADWKKHGRAAGPIRNQERLDSGIDFVIACPGGRGTADMVRRARKAGIEVREVL